MKDWAFTTSVEEMEAATNSLLENGKKVGADTWQQRVKNQTPHCGFGEGGTCCRICSMGPCRITKKAPRGISMDIVRDRMDAEECVNDTWIKTWNSIPPQRPDSLLLTGSAQP